MKWIIAPVFAAPMMAEAVMGPDLWFKFSFAAGALLLLVLILVPERTLIQPVEEKMPTWATQEQVLDVEERRAQRVQRWVNHVRSAKL